MKWIDNLPLTALLLVALTLGLAPFSPQPHIVEKLGMLFDGSLSRPIDIFDLLLHGAPWILLALKLARMALSRSN
ncbi:MAG: RND transporter [Gammaproteobacteria bacterium]|nr:RND transporter [Gammaproteobacteria bacterium]